MWYNNDIWSSGTILPPKRRFMKNSAKRPMAVWLMITIDLILLAAFLSTFCYYHIRSI